MSALSTIPPMIGKLIPRLATEFDGEVVATVRAIEKTLKGAGLDFHDLAKAIGTSAAAKAEKPPRRARRSPQPKAKPRAETKPRAKAEPQGWDFNDEPTTWAELVTWCREMGAGRLKPNDADFLHSMALHLASGGEPSPAQAKWLQDIEAKLQRAGR